MKNYLTLTCAFLLSIMNCSAQYYNWITGGGSDETMTPGYNYENVTNMCTDSKGNVYITATVGRSNVRADTFYELSTHNAFSSNAHVLFASYKCDGTMRWAKIIESSNETFIGHVLDGVGNSGIAYSNGSVYTVGVFYGGTKYIGNDTSFTDNNLSFIARFDTLGHMKWIRMIGPDVASTSTLTGDAGTIAVDGAGYIHNFNSMKAGVALSTTFTTDTNGTYDLKYDTMGNLVSANRVKLDSSWTILKVVFNKNNGKYYAVLVPDASYWYTYHANQNTAICSFLPDGHINWMDTTGPNGDVYSLAYDNRNGIYTCGRGQYPDTFSLGGISVTDTAFPTYYAFATIFKLDTNGHGHWVYNLQSNLGVDRFLDICLLPGSKIAAVGVLAGTSIRGRDTIVATPGELSNPLFLVLDSLGNTLKLDQLHGPGNDDQGSCLAADQGSNIYIGGMLDATMNATGLTAYSSNGGNTDYYLVKYGFNDCDTLIPLSAPATLTNGYPTQVSVYPNPATEELNIKGVTEESTYQVLDITGKPWCKGLLQPGPNTISTKNLQPGLYLIDITQKDGTKQIIRLVIE